MQYIALEGIPGGGKTSTIEHLDIVLGGEVYVISEHVLTDKDLTEFTRDNPAKEDAYRLNWLIKDSIVQLYSYKKYVVTDRCFITALAYAYSLSKYCKDSRPYDDALSWCDTAINRGCLHIPTHCIILAVNPDVSNARKQRKESKDMLWSQAEALIHANEFYTAILPTLPNLYKKLSIINSPDDNLIEVKYRVEQTILSSDILLYS